MRLLAGPAVPVQQSCHITAGVLCQSVIYRAEKKHGYVTVTQNAELHGSSHEAVLPLDIRCLQQALSKSCVREEKTGSGLLHSLMTYLTFMVVFYPDHLCVLPIHCNQKQE